MTCIVCGKPLVLQQRRYCGGECMPHDRGRYRLGCRCDACRGANTQFFREYRKAHKQEGVRVRKRCRVDGCYGASHGQGVCKRHYQRLIRNGDTELHPRIPLRFGGPLRPSHIAVLKFLADSKPQLLEDISEATGVSERTVQKALADIRARFGYDTIRTVYNPTRYRLAEKLPVKSWAVNTPIQGVTQ